MFRFCGFDETFVLCKGPLATRSARLLFVWRRSRCATLGRVCLCDRCRVRGSVHVLGLPVRLWEVKALEGLRVVALSGEAADRLAFPSCELQCSVILTRSRVSGEHLLLFGSCV